jgi:hypothetical protein
LHQAEFASRKTQELRDTSKPVFLFYPCRDENKGEETNMTTTGFALLFPRNDLPKRFAFTVAAKDRPDAVIIDSNATYEK